MAWHKIDFVRFIHNINEVQYYTHFNHVGSRDLSEFGCLKVVVVRAEVKTLGENDKLFICVLVNGPRQMELPVFQWKGPEQNVFS